MSFRFEAKFQTFRDIYRIVFCSISLSVYLKPIIRLLKPGYAHLNQGTPSPLYKEFLRQQYVFVCS